MIVQDAGVSTTRFYSPAPIRGGFAGQVDVFLNIFQLRLAQINTSGVTDDLDRAWGIYNRNRRPALIRMFNPFYYLARLLDLVAEIPFAIAGTLGFNRSKAEGSPCGRAAKIIVKLVTFMAALLTILNLLGLLEGIREALFG